MLYLLYNLSLLSSSSLFVMLINYREPKEENRNKKNYILVHYVIPLKWVNHDPRIDENRLSIKNHIKNQLLTIKSIFRCKSSIFSFLGYSGSIFRIFNIFLLHYCVVVHFHLVFYQQYRSLNNNSNRHHKIKQQQKKTVTIH